MSDPGSDRRSPIERTIARSFVDDAGVGKPLSRRARQTRRTIESYLAAGFMPRYMERLREIEGETKAHERRLARAYDRLAEACASDPEGFARRWRALAKAWRFDQVNDLIREHNEWYPTERALPMDPRTGDYVRVRGRSYRREELGPGWVLERFPPALEAARARHAA